MNDSISVSRSKAEQKHQKKMEEFTEFVKNQSPELAEAIKEFNIVRNFVENLDAELLKAGIDKAARNKIKYEALKCVVLAVASSAGIKVLIANAVEHLAPLLFTVLSGIIGKHG